MRLTEELPMGSYRAKTIYLEPNRNEEECIYKLGQVEDIVKKYNIESLDDLDNRLKALEIIINYTYSGGWRGDYTTRY